MSTTAGPIEAPGGLAVFMEPLGRNPLINRYRRLTLTLRTVDEYPLMMEKPLKGE